MNRKDLFMFSLKETGVRRLRLQLLQRVANDCIIIWWKADLCAPPTNTHRLFDCQYVEETRRRGDGLCSVQQVEMHHFQKWCLHLHFKDTSDHVEAQETRCKVNKRERESQTEEKEAECQWKQEMNRLYPVFRSQQSSVCQPSDGSNVVTLFLLFSAGRNHNGPLED